MTPWLDDGDVQLYHGDALEQLRGMPSESVHCAITSPPFYSLRDYGMDGQIGLEDTLDEWLTSLDWMTREEIPQAIPPAYTEHIGLALMRRLNTKVAS